MNNLLYLIGAVLLSAVAIGALKYRNRRPKSMEAGMREFERGLKALDPTNDPRKRPVDGREGRRSG